MPVLIRAPKEETISEKIHHIATMDFNIRDARREDMEQVHGLIRELAVFEKEGPEVEVTVEDLQTSGFGPQPDFHCFVAESGDAIVGIALVFWRFSTWKGKALHLEDLIVTEAARGKGLGNALLNEVVKYGHAHGVRRIQWEVLDWNEPAIKFYEAKGARVLRDWNVVHLREKEIQTYIKALAE